MIQCFSVSCMSLSNKGLLITDETQQTETILSVDGDDERLDAK